jgi:uncharacterized protein YbjQ (UPF0145 family)
MIHTGSDWIPLVHLSTRRWGDKSLPIDINSFCPNKTTGSRVMLMSFGLIKKNSRPEERQMNQPVDTNLVTTAFELPGYQIVRNLGIVRGIVVRSRSVFGTLGGALQTLVGGNITLFTNLCEKTREDAFALMLEHAGERGANAVIGMRYDANEVMDGVTEVLAYGAAVEVRKCN